MTSTMNAASMRSSAAAPAPSNPVTAVATPTAPDRPSQHDAAAPHRFADLLRQSRSERAALPAAAAHEEPTSEGTTPTEDQADAASTALPARHSATPAKAHAPTAKGATCKASIDNARANAEPVANDSDRDEAAAASAAPTSTGERAASLAALGAAVAADSRTAQLAAPSDATADPHATASARDRDSSLSALSPEGAQQGGLHARGEAAVDATIGRAATVDAGIAAATPTAVDQRLHATVGAAARAIEAAPASARGSAATDAAAASLAASSTTRVLGEPQGLAATPGALTLATPIDAPDFAATLGIQVSLLAHDGVQRAELHLHPAETGPVSIQIAVDGNAARIDFGADHAATRQAIERGLPELASALRDAGLTLAGGSVSQHAGNRQSGEDGAAASRARRDASGAAAPIASTTRLPRHVAAGGVDLYA